MLPEGKDQGIDREVVGTDMVLALSGYSALVGSHLGDDPRLLGFRLGRVPLSEQDLATTSGEISDSHAGLTGRVTSIGRGCSAGSTCHA